MVTISLLSMFLFIAILVVAGIAAWILVPTRQTETLNFCTMGVIIIVLLAWLSNSSMGYLMQFVSLLLMQALLGLEVLGGWLLMRKFTKPHIWNFIGGTCVMWVTVAINIAPSLVDKTIKAP